MRFSNSLIYVEDLKKTLAFYEAAFGLKIGFVSEQETYGECDTGPTKLSFATEKLVDKEFQIPYIKNRPKHEAPGFEITFEVDDIDGAYARAVAHGAFPVLAPVRKPWGQRVAYLRDLNGIYVELSAID